MWYPSCGLRKCQSCQIACLCSSRPTYVWQLELAVNRSESRKGETSLSSCLPFASFFQKSGLAKQALQLPWQSANLSPCRSLQKAVGHWPNCNDSHVIKVRRLWMEGREGERRRAPYSDTSSFPFVKLSALVRPRLFPRGLGSETDGPDGWTNRQGSPFLPWTQTHTSQSWSVCNFYSCDNALMSLFTAVSGLFLQPSPSFMSASISSRVLHLTQCLSAHLPLSVAALHFYCAVACQEVSPPRL